MSVEEKNRIYDDAGWIDSAEQSDDKINGIWCALIALAKSQERIAFAIERITTILEEGKEK